MNQKQITSFFVVILMLVGTHLVQASDKKWQKWAKGMVVLTNGNRLYGHIRYDWRSNGVRFQTADNRQRAYSVQQLQHFSYFDPDENRIRQFAAVSFPVNAVLTRPLFLEEVLTGPITVYRRPHNHRRPTAVTSLTRYILGGWLATDDELFDYFVYTNNGFTAIEQFSQQFWPKFQKDQSTTTWTYVSADQRISPATLTGQLRLIARYNEMPHAVEPTLSE